MDKFRQIHHKTGLCVVGGGLAGLCAAVAAARRGCQVVLMQDRPMLGGNASSEIRMWISGAHGKNNRETGILEELQLENYHRNPYKNYSIWDSILYEKARCEQNLTLLLNCSCLDASMDGARIVSVTGWQTTTQTYHIVTADIFADCSGDSVLAPLSGAPFRQGREGRPEFGESIAPDTADAHTMGMSILLQARETPCEKVYIPPGWAEKFTAETLLPHRLPDPGDCLENYWYLELGGTDDTIHDTEVQRDKLLAAAYGMWDFVKNSGYYGKQYANYDLDWVGFLPGKRESRRYIGDYIMTQHDVQNGGKFDDIIAYGGWTMDDHHPSGLRAAEPPTVWHPAPSPFGIPYRCLYSKSIENLMFAGRNISVTHAAMSATRVMGTCALLGQALGTAAALAVRNATTPRGVYDRYINTLQAHLMEDDCWLPGLTRTPPQRTLHAYLSGGDEALRNGCERPDKNGANAWRAARGERAVYTFEKPEFIRKARLVFDSDLARDTQPPPTAHGDIHRRPMYANRYLDTQATHVPRTLVKDFDLVLFDGTRIPIRGNCRRLVMVDIGRETSSIALEILDTWGDNPVNVFTFEVS